MGREARQRIRGLRTPAPKAPRLALPAADYWKFRAHVNDVGAIEAEAAQAAAKFKQRIAGAAQRASDLFAQLGKAHGFDPLKTYGWDDATCELIRVEST